MSARYPFTAIVGMDDLRLALLLNAVSPAVGGVLVRGEKGTAKSTAVRALAGLLPALRVVDGCRFACDPAAPDAQCPDGPHAAGDPASDRATRLVELPVGVSEDRIVGSLDLERALAEGVKAYEPGLLAAAHRGVLYIDEVNLLNDHLVDLLLDAAAMGQSYVEREGVSVRHAARFLLVGTMNPEEGELRPQLLDRFGLTVEIAATRDPEQRAEVVRRRLGYDADPEGFAGRWAEDERKLAERVLAAQQLLPQVVLTDTALRQITATCAAFEVDGLRADIVMARTAVALAAWAGRTTVLAEDVRTAAKLALPHRRRRNPFDAPGLDEEKLEQTLQQSAGPEEDPGEGPEDDGPPSGGGAGAARTRPRTAVRTAVRTVRASSPTAAPGPRRPAASSAAPAPAPAPGRRRPPRRASPTGPGSTRSRERARAPPGGARGPGPTRGATPSARRAPAARCSGCT